MWTQIGSDWWFSRCFWPVWLGLNQFWWTVMVLASWDDSFSTNKIELIPSVIRTWLATLQHCDRFRMFAQLWTPFRCSTITHPSEKDQKRHPELPNESLEPSKSIVFPRGSYAIASHTILPNSSRIAPIEKKTDSCKAQVCLPRLSRKLANSE